MTDRARELELPEASRLELPLLLEIAAEGGAAPPALAQRLSGRLLAYFPQLEPESLSGSCPERRRWRRLLTRAASRLVERGELRRSGRALSLTARGQERLGAEALVPERPPPPPPVDRHRALQHLLLDLGALLGKDVALEHDNYDVVWRERRGAPRLSHVFEVQVAGSVDSALTRLKRAHEAQRSRLYLVVADERSCRFAEARLREAFPELEDAVRLVGAGELERLHGALAQGRGLLAGLLGP